MRAAQARILQASPATPMPRGATALPRKIGAGGKTDGPSLGRKRPRRAYGIEGSPIDATV